MNKIEKIIVLAKELAVSLFKGDKIDSKEVDAFFDRQDADEIIEKLSDPKLRKDYEVMLKIINKSKKDDWKTLKSMIEPDYKIRYIKNFSKVAAVLVLCFGLTYFFKSEMTQSIVVNPSPGVMISEDAITLTLDNGNIEVITADGKRKIFNKKGEIVGNQSGTELNYAKKASKNTVNETLAYNELTIPYGKIFKLVLSDGTIVHLNSGSSLKYPVKFIKGLERGVFLKGEAFFDVAKDKEHPFIVNANNLDVRVLGTQFNVTSYPEDNFVNTVLVEGSVSLYEDDINSGHKNAQLLTPGNKASWNKSEKNIDIERVDTSIYTAWIDGEIVFEHMPFKNILKKLERHYNVTISNTNAILAEETFTATFDIESIEQVLSAFNKSYSIDYSINGDKIFIK
jgi:transmembrane sensor